MKTRPTWVLLLAALFSSSLALAQEPAPEPAGAEAPESADAGEAANYRLFGYFRVGGTMIQNDPEVAFVGRNDGFSVQNARVGFEMGWRQVHFRISAEGAHDERVSANAVNGILRFGLRDAYADVQLHRLAQLRVGQFYATADLDEITSNTQRHFIDRALESRGIAATEGWETSGLRAGRSVGLALRAPCAVGGAGWGVGYELALQNGTAENIATNDNDALAYSGALLFQFPGQGSAFIAARHNRRTEGDLPVQKFEEDLSGSVGLRLGFWSFGFEGQAVVRQTRFATVGGPDAIAYGVHTGAYWRWNRPTFWLEPVTRIAMLEPSDLVLSDRIREFSVGANVGFPALHTRVQANFTRVLEEKARTLDNDRIEAVVEVSF